MKERERERALKREGKKSRWGKREIRDGKER